MDVSIIIINYNTLQITSNCIDSIINMTTDIQYEIILVDNASTDGSKELFEKDCRIKYIYNDKNLGFGRANNIGLKIAQGRNVLFLNSDTLLVNNAIKILSDYLDANPNVGACGGNLYTMDGRPNISYNKRFPSITEELDQSLFRILSKLLFKKNSLFNNTNKPIDVCFICGADLMASYSLLKILGGFDPDFFMYYEETELCWRIKKMGYRIMNIPNAKITHLDGKSFSENARRLQLSYVSRKIYFQKTHDKIYNNIVNYMYYMLISCAVLTYAVIGNRNQVMKFKTRKSIFKEIYGI